MKYNFCTLFDSYYLTRGIALYRSLELYCNNFHLYIFTFDDKSYAILGKLNFRHATIISLKDFENENLIRVKPTRTIAEYCWTCTASTIWYSINKFDLDHCTYLDADIVFFSSPSPIYEEIGNNSIGITPHNFTPKLKSSEILGKYCVQFTYFRNDTDGLKALNWWKNKCIEWCYAKMEDDKYADQKYLDHFPAFFKNVHIVENIGAGVAPWNINNFIVEVENQIYVKLAKKGGVNTRNNLIFYHFQGLKFIKKEQLIISEASSIFIPKIALNFIYKPYIINLNVIESELRNVTETHIEIIFKRNWIKVIISFFNRIFKRYFIARKLFYLLKRDRYNRPQGIGTKF